jgi:asparagine synthase (glutamine-hydrolysing)
MAVLFGRWTEDRQADQTIAINRARANLAAYYFGSCHHFHRPGIEILFFPFEAVEQTPVAMPIMLDSGEVLFWDGRLDNGAELLGQLGQPIEPHRCDAEIVASAWGRWGRDALGKLLGDWMLCIWNAATKSLVLATDYLATKHIYYQLEKGLVVWSTIPDLLLSGNSLTLDEEYLAGWLTSFPSASRTPFREISRVPPATCVTISAGKATTAKYWDFDGARRTTYSKDSEYEEHFLSLLSRSVERRLRSPLPILAELSGGMDSSAVVCVADEVTRRLGRSLIDTVSFFDDREAHWNERPYFEEVEKKRQKRGLHVDVAQQHPQAVDAFASQLRFSPGSTKASNHHPVIDFMAKRGHRVLLSGIGGDEFLGGVPTPLPELENLIARFRIIKLGIRLLTWSMVQRRPWIRLLYDALIGFFPPDLERRSRSQPKCGWLNAAFARRNQKAIDGYPERWHLRGPLPSFQENVDALNRIRRQLSCVDLYPGYPFERRYPLLDRDLLEFLFSIPREQLVRPGQRRSLMRRALKDIVPNPILNRRRKAFISSSPIRAADEDFRWTSLNRSSLLTERLGIVDTKSFLASLDGARCGKLVPWIPLTRTVVLEMWLRGLDWSGTLDLEGSFHAGQTEVLLEESQLALNDAGQR